MSSFVSDPKIVDKNEYAIVVGKNQYEEFVIFLCSSQEEITAKFDAEIGDWYLYNSEKKIFKRIKSPVPTEVFKTKKGETVIQVTVPVVHLKPYPKLELPFNTSNTLLSPILGLVGAMFTPDVNVKFDKASLYNVKAFWLPNSLHSLREIKKQGSYFWAADRNGIEIIPSNKLVSNSFIKHKSCLRVSVEESLTYQSDLIHYYRSIDLSLPSQPILVISSKNFEFSDSLSVFVLPVHIKNKSKKIQILNIGIELEHEDFQFSDKIEYEPTGVIDFHQQNIQPAINGNGNGIITGNGIIIGNGIITGNGAAATKALDFRKAVKADPVVVEKSVAITNPSSNSRSTSKSSSPDGFHVVQKKRVTKTVGQTFDESKYLEDPPEPEEGKIYTGVLVSQDNKQNYYIYSPLLPYEIQLAAATELPKDLQISDFVEFKCNSINATYYYTRPSAEFIRKMAPLHKCGMLKNSVYVQCKIFIPSTFHPTKSPVAFTDFVPKVADKNGLLAIKDAGKKGTCVITRTKNTQIPNVFWLIHRIQLS